MKLIIACSMLLLVATFAWADGDQEAIDNAKQAVIASMKDPSTVQFRGIWVRTGKRSKAICGEVNAKNSYGGYVGFRKFYFLSESQSILVQSGDQVTDSLVDSICMRVK